MRDQRRERILTEKWEFFPFIQVSLKDKDLRFCVGCLACQNTETCVIRDDMDRMIDQVKNADVIVFATPVYYYGVSGQPKIFLDRCNPLYIAEYKFREVYLVTASTEEGEEVYQITQAGIQGWVDCFPKAVFCKTLSDGGLSNPNEATPEHSLIDREKHSTAHRSFVDWWAVLRRIRPTLAGRHSIQGVFSDSISVIMKIQHVDCKSEGNI